MNIIPLVRDAVFLLSPIRLCHLTPQNTVDVDGKLKQTFYIDFDLTLHPTLPNANHITSHGCHQQP
jgi:hypothetical protein